MRSLAQQWGSDTSARGVPGHGRAAGSGFWEEIPAWEGGEALEQLPREAQGTQR